jgi:hypothetical protein
MYVCMMCVTVYIMHTGIHEVMKINISMLNSYLKPRIQLNTSQTYMKVQCKMKKKL